MSEPFLSEIRIMAFAYPPRGWALCNGQPLPINQNQALFSLLGTTYGGDGRTTFNLPNFQGKVPVHANGGSYRIGQTGGEQAHTLTLGELPQHAHWLNGTSNNASQPAPAGNLFATVNNGYAAAANLTAINPATVGPTGGSQAHENMQPYLALNFCIALQGIFPSPN
jgi:microcystin-dependent protein